MMFRNILKYVLTMCLIYFVGYIILYNVILYDRSLSQISWKIHYLILFLICGILGIILRSRYKR